MFFILFFIKLCNQPLCRVVSFRLVWFRFISFHLVFVIYHRAAKNMLSESSVASVVYYWLEFRDDLTPQWMKQFTYRNGDIKDIGWNQ